MLERGAWKPHPLSPATTNRIKSAYRSFFKWAFETRRITSDPAARLDLAKTRSRPTTPITVKEINDLLNAIRASDDRHAERDEALFSVYAFTGIIRSEALSLTMRDYDAQAAALYLPKTKSGSRHVRSVLSPLADILKKRTRHSPYADDQPNLLTGGNPDRALSARQAQARFVKWKDLAGIRKGLTIHSFRAGFATSLYEKTGDILLVSRAMGHSDIRTTRRYIRENNYRISQAVEMTFGINRNVL
jgi:integrase/recombinase XerC